MDFSERVVTRMRDDSWHGKYMLVGHGDTPNVGVQTSERIHQTYYLLQKQYYTNYKKMYSYL